MAIPYGIYDQPANRGSVFAPTTRLPLADTGGSNGSRCRNWKLELQGQLCNAFDLTVTVAHYPTGASKWNPIEHRLFSEISKNWAAEPLDTYHKILNFIRTTETQTGLIVKAYLDRTHYPTGIEPDPLHLTPHATLFVGPAAATETLSE